MTRESILKRIVYFSVRMESAKSKGGHTLARNKWREARRQLLCYDATGGIAGWTNFKLKDSKEE